MGSATSLTWDLVQLISFCGHLLFLPSWPCHCPHLEHLNSVAKQPSNKTVLQLTDVSLVDEDTNSILADNANRAIQGNVAMQVAPPDVHFNQILGFQPNFRISTNFQDFTQISGFWPNFRISTKFQDFDQISGFWPNFRILIKFHDFDQISGCWQNFRILTKFPDFDQI